MNRMNLSIIDRGKKIWKRNMARKYAEGIWKRNIAKDYGKEIW